MLLLVSRRRDALAEHYRFLLPDRQRVEDLTNKVRFARLAAELGLPAPATLVGSEISSAGEVEEALSLPCIVKPNTHLGWFTSDIVRSEGGQPRKALRASTRGELDRYLAAMRACGDDFLVQEYIPGDDACIYSFHAYADAAGRVLAWFVGRKIRTYPKVSGVSTCLELVEEPELARLGLEVLRRLRFVGVVKLDFKLDPIRRQFVLLEVNPRFCLWNRLGAACGINLATIAHRDLAGQPVPRPRGYRTGIRWLSFGDDLRAFLREYRRDGDLTAAQYAASLCGPLVCDVFSWHDPMPFLACMRGHAAAVARGLRRRIRAPRRAAAPSGAAGAAPPLAKGVAP